MTQTRQRPADEAGRRGGAKVVRAGQRNHTTRRANPVSFVLRVNDRYRLTADELSWRIERRKGKNWRPIAYHSSIECAVNDLGRRAVRTAHVRSLARLPWLQ